MLGWHEKNYFVRLQMAIRQQLLSHKIRKMTQIWYAKPIKQQQHTCELGAQMAWLLMGPSWASAITTPAPSLRYTTGQERLKKPNLTDPFWKVGDSIKPHITCKGVVTRYSFSVNLSWNFLLTSAPTELEMYEIQDYCCCCWIVRRKFYRKVQRS